MSQRPAPRTIPLVDARGPVRFTRRRTLGVLSLALVVLAWVYGYLTSGRDVVSLVGAVVPGAATVDLSGTIYVARSADGAIAGYAAVGSAPGYGGPIDMLVGVSPAGVILGTRVVAQRETPGFFRRFNRDGFFTQYTGVSIARPLELGRDLDGMSGATLSAEGIASGIRRAVRVVARDGLLRTLPPERTRIEWGAPEVVLLLLFAAGYAGHRLERRRLKRAVRWSTMIAGLVLLGFVYTAPLTIAQVVALVTGYWPDWRNNLYWYVLVGGVLFSTANSGRNPYCGWFCPFGAFQECLAAMTRAPVYRPDRLHLALRWVQRGLALAAILLGLALRRPGIATYEPYAPLFSITGSVAQWTLLAVVSLASLVVYRPFCSYLCPIDPVLAFVREGRQWIREEWHAWRSNAAIR
jgi:NosR/NirI family nitrous oxide reductase transcriptional regulator